MIGKSGKGPDVRRDESSMAGSDCIETVNLLIHTRRYQTMYVMRLSTVGSHSEVLNNVSQ